MADRNIIFRSTIFGRPLTAQEKAQGLIAASPKRQKVAIVVGSDNPFTGDLSFRQFAQIFRGEIKDWSEVGGQPGRIQLIDRPATNDTRQALENYEIFKQVPFVAADNAATTAVGSQAAVPTTPAVTPTATPGSRQYKDRYRSPSNKSA